MNKKIVFIIPNLQGGGAERTVLTLASGFEKQLGVQCYIVVFSTKIEHQIPDGKKILLFPIRQNSSKRQKARAIDCFIREQIGEPAAVFANLTEVDKIMKYSRLPVFHIIHSTPSQGEWGRKKGLSRLLAWWKTKNYYNHHPSICVSQGVLADFVKYINRRAYCIYNPLDIAQLQAKAMAFTPDVTNYIVSVGTFNRAKNRSLLLRAYARLHTDKKLVIVGRKADQYEKCKQLVKELALEKQVIFTGFQSNPYPYMKQADLFVLSSDYEGLPTVLMEAVALGTPVVSTDCPSGPAEIIGTHTHCLTPVGDVEKLATAMQNALQNPSQYRVDLPPQMTLAYACKEYAKLWETKRFLS